MSEIYDFFYNALTGNVSPDQLAQIQAQETAALIQAGASPSHAATQAQQDATAALSTFSGQGGLGTSWTGALPSQSGFGTAVASDVTGAVKWLGSHWILVVAAAVILLLLVAYAYGGFR